MRGFYHFAGLTGLVVAGLVLRAPVPAQAQCAYDWTPSGGGLAGFNSTVYSTVIYDDGSGPALYAGGNFTIAGNQVIRYLAKWDGTSWQPVNGPGGGGLKGAVLDLVVYNGDLIAVGSFTYADNTRVNYIARWDGATWSSLNGGVTLGPYISQISTALVHNNKLIVGGLFKNIGGVDANNIAVWDGTSWAPLGNDANNGVDGEVNALAIHNGELYAGGAFTHAGGISANRIARWDGTSWAPLGDGLAEGGDQVTPISVYTMASYNGRLIAGGTFLKAGGVDANYIAQWDGAAWSTIGSADNNGTDHYVHELTIYEGDLIVGGQFRSAGGIVTGGIVKWNGETWSKWSDAPGQDIWGRVYSMTVSNGELIVAGVFAKAGEMDTGSIAAWNGSSWTSFGNGDSVLGNHINAVTVYQGELIAAGRFSLLGGARVNNIARWNGSTWLPLGEGDNNGVNADAYTLTVYDGKLIVGGFFTSAGGVDAHKIAQWDGVSWSSLNTGQEVFLGSINAMTVWNNDLVVGGDFSQIGNIEAHCIAKWDGESWSAIGVGTGNGVNDSVTALTSFRGDLIVGGYFSHAGGIPAKSVAKWNGSTWSSLGGAPAYGIPSGYVAALAVYDGALYVGGHFRGAGDVRGAFNIARWDGNEWSILGTEFANGVAGEARALVEYNGLLHVGSPRRIAIWNGSSWLPFVGELDGEVYALTTYASQLVVAGNFDLAGDKVSFYWARWGPVGPFADADFDRDCFVDPDDTAVFKACATGAAVPYPPGGLPPDCTLTPDAEGYIPADLDRDNDVDQSDFGLFQRCYGGAGVIAALDCSE